MRILSWNIRHGGKRRADRIVAALDQHRPDCIVLMEFRAEPGEVIRRRLQEGGWVHQAATASEGSGNGLLVAARTTFVPLDVVSGLDPMLFLPVSFPESKFHMWAAHIPCWKNGEPANTQPKTQFWDALLRIASTDTQPTLLLGDFNTGRHGIDEPGKTFKLADRFEQLSAKWTDAWRHLHGDKREFSWFSTSGNGFRIDHAFVTASLSDRVEGAEYSHAEREQGVSDHSPLIVNIRDA